MLDAITGARPGKINMMFSPNSARLRLFPERKPSPRPTSSSNDPTPQATPNMVRNERSLCAHRVRRTCPKMSRIIRIIVYIVSLDEIYHENVRLKISPIDWKSRLRSTIRTALSTFLKNHESAWKRNTPQNPSIRLANDDFEYASNL